MFKIKTRNKLTDKLLELVQFGPFTPASVDCCCGAWIIRKYLKLTNDFFNTNFSLLL